MARIDHWHTQMPGIGTRKLVRQLKNEGFSVGRKLVRRLMGEMGIQAIYPKANLFTKADLHRRPLTLTVWSWLVERLRRGCGVG